jgi:hypothetical protein
MMDDRPDRWRRFYASLTGMGRFRLLLGIFLLFAPAPLVHDLAFRRPFLFYRVLWWSIGFGSLAVASAEVFDREDEELGLDGFADAVQSVVNRPLLQAHASLLERVRRFGPQTDDQTLLLMRRR